MHNLGTVMRFEIIRTMKKKSFWLVALGFPVMMAAVFAIIFFANSTASDSADKLKDEKFSFLVTDRSHLISPQILEQSGARTTTDKAAAIESVKRGEIDAYFYYPEDIATGTVEVYGKNISLFDNGKYDSVAKMLLQTSTAGRIDPSLQAIATDRVKSDVVFYRDGQAYDPIKEMIVPGFFLVLFYMLIAFFGNQMLTSTTEEKENRVIEMLLTTVNARTLIVGKIYALILLAFIQGGVIVLPAIVGYLLLGDRLNMPSLDVSSLVFDPARIVIAIALFAASFIMLTGILVAVGASVPTAKEAGNFIGIVMIMLFGPLYAFMLFITNPESPVVRFLTLFPLTAPIPLLLRNAVGNLEAWEIVAGLAILIISAVIAMRLAVQLFRYGALEYSRTLSFKEIFAKKKV